jgi:predicted RNA methylase
MMAAQKFKADATGVELDPSLARQSSEEIRRSKLDTTARIIQGDILIQDYSSADLVTAYLLPKAMQLVRPILEKQLKKGARVVAHDFEMTGWTPEKVETVEDDGEGRSHTIYLYRR